MEKTYFDAGEIERIARLSLSGESLDAFLKGLNNSSYGLVIPSIKTHSKRQFELRTILPQKSLEDTVYSVKVFFDNYVKQIGEGVVIAYELEEETQCAFLIVKEDGTLWRVKINLCDADDISEQYETQVKDPDSETMNRGFWTKDTMTVRQFYHTFQLEHTLIPQYFHPLY